MKELIFPTVMPTLETKRLLLREIDHHDLEAYFALCSEEATMRPYGIRAHKNLAETTNTINYLHDEFAKKRALRMGIFLKPSGLLIGDGGFWQFDYRRRRGEGGAKIAIAHSRQGYMFEALTALINFAFANLTIYAVEGNVAVDNIASQKLMAKLGFIKEGQRREFIYCAYEDRFKDSYLFSLLKNDVGSAHE